ncbi:MAG: hypothetical protein ABEN55_12830, partial [Bradymonadaceae bacterium]
DDEPSEVREVEPRGPSGPAEQRPGGATARWGKRIGIGVVAVAVVAVGYSIWTQVQPLRARSTLDARLTRLDPNDPPEFEPSGMSGR